MTFLQYIQKLTNSYVEDIELLVILPCKFSLFQYRDRSGDRYRDTRDYSDYLRSIAGPPPPSSHYAYGHAHGPQYAPPPARYYEGQSVSAGHYERSLYDYERSRSYDR